MTVCACEKNLDTTHRKRRDACARSHEFPGFWFCLLFTCMAKTAWFVDSAILQFLQFYFKKFRRISDRSESGMFKYNCAFMSLLLRKKYNEAREGRCNLSRTRSITQRRRVLWTVFTVSGTPFPDLPTLKTIRTENDPSWTRNLTMIFKIHFTPIK